MGRKTKDPATPVENAGGFPAVSEKAVLDLAQLFKLMSDETRLRILLYLGQSSELNVTELCTRLGQSQPAVSHHLALMRVSGLIEARRSGKNNYYGINGDRVGEMLAKLFPAGEVPPRLRFLKFVLAYSGE